MHAERVRACFCFFSLMSFFLLFLGREPGGGPSQRVATIIMLICAGWLPQDNQIDRELPGVYLRGSRAEARATIAGVEGLFDPPLGSRPLQ